MEKDKILIAEDDSDIRELLTLYLESNNYKVSLASNGEEALEKLESDFFDLAIVDIMMPKMNGYELIKKVRSFSDIPIIITSAKSLDNDKILGIDIGADVYITKPFNPLEVVAYVKSLLKKKNVKLSVITIGELILDQEKYTLKKQNEEISLTSVEYKILAKMMNNPGQVFTKSQLYEYVNGGYFKNDDNTMMVHISNLRSKIEDDPAHPKYIKTIRGVGYKIENKKEQD